jgi:hypothetical protein
MFLKKYKRQLFKKKIHFHTIPETISVTRTVHPCPITIELTFIFEFQKHFFEILFLRIKTFAKQLYF